MIIPATKTEAGKAKELHLKKIEEIGQIKDENKRVIALIKEVNRFCQELSI